MNTAVFDWIVLNLLRSESDFAPTAEIVVFLGEAVGVPVNGLALLVVDALLVKFLAWSRN